jgi:hypothetical protein
METTRKANCRQTKEQIEDDVMKSLKLLESISKNEVVVP